MNGSTEDHSKALGEEMTLSDKIREEVKRLLKETVLRDYTHVIMKADLDCLMARIKKHLPEDDHCERCNKVGRAKNKDGEYDPLMVQLWYLKELEAKSRELDKLKKEDKADRSCFSNACEGIQLLQSSEQENDGGK